MGRNIDRSTVGIIRIDESNVEGSEKEEKEEKSTMIVTAGPKPPPPKSAIDVCSGPEQSELSMGRFKRERFKRRF